MDVKSSWLKDLIQRVLTGKKKKKPPHFFVFQFSETFYYRGKMNTSFMLSSSEFQFEGFLKEARKNLAK